MSEAPEWSFFEPFGQRLHASITNSDDARYTDHEFDPTSGFNYMKGRYQSPVYARFLRPDPMRDWDLENPNTINLYQYVRNNPIINTDPNGEELVAILLTNARSVSVNTKTRGHVIVVDRSMVSRVVALVFEAEAKGTRLTITSSFRTNEEQSGLNSSNAVTPAKPGSSPHNAGLALDGIDGKSNSLPDSVIDQAEELGMRWGGKFKKKDDVHIDIVESNDQKRKLIKENQQQWKKGTVEGMVLDAKTGKLTPANIPNAKMKRKSGKTSAVRTETSVAPTKTLWERFKAWVKS